MSDVQDGKINYITSKWREGGYTDVERYPADDSDDVLIVGTGKEGAEPVAARVNTDGVARAGKVDRPDLAQPLVEVVEG